MRPPGSIIHPPASAPRPARLIVGRVRRTAKRRLSRWRRQVGDHAAEPNPTPTHRRARWGPRPVAARGRRRLESRGVVPASVATRRAGRLEIERRRRGSFSGGWTSTNNAGVVFRSHPPVRRSDSALHHTPQPDPLRGPRAWLGLRPASMIAHLTPPPARPVALTTVFLSATHCSVTNDSHHVSTTAQPW